MARQVHNPFVQYTFNGADPNQWRTRPSRPAPRRMTREELDANLEFTPDRKILGSDSAVVNANQRFYGGKDIDSRDARALDNFETISDAERQVLLQDDRFRQMRDVVRSATNRPSLSRYSSETGALQITPRDQVDAYIADSKNIPVGDDVVRQRLSADAAPPRKQTQTTTKPKPEPYFDAPANRFYPAGKPVTEPAPVPKQKSKTSTKSKPAPKRRSRDERLKLLNSDAMVWDPVTKEPLSRAALIYDLDKRGVKDYRKRANAINTFTKMIQNYK